MAKAKNNMRIYTLYSVLLLFLVLAGWFGTVIYQAKQAEVKLAAQENVSTPTTLPPSTTESSNETNGDALPSPETIYPNTRSMVIRDIEVQASVAETWPERIEGLSNTPYLPEGVVKLFVFDSAGFHSFWMKDMNYGIDILWVNEASEIVHIEQEASPESYPAMFVPNEEARYVIETVAGFVEKHGLVLGDSVVLPTL